MGQIGLAIKMIDGKIDLKMKVNQGSNAEISLLSTYLNNLSRQLEVQVAKMSKWSFNFDSGGEDENK